MKTVKFQSPRSLLLRKDGAFTLNGAFILLLVSALLLLSISVLGVANASMRLRSMAEELLRYTELRGQVDSVVWAEKQRLENAIGLDVDCTIDADYISGTSKVQFGHSIVVDLSSDQAFGLGGVFQVPIRLHTTASGRSEQYWK